MAVGPISLPQYQRQPDLDFSSLQQIPQQLRQRQAEQTLANLQRGPDGQIDTSPLYASGDMNLAQLGMQIDRNRAMEGRDTRDFNASRSDAERNYQFKVKESERDQQNTERNLAVAEAKATKVKEKDLPFGVVKELNERGGAHADFSRLGSSFDDSYGGYKIEKAGDLANFAARNLGIGNEAGATWWQDYQTQKNLIRNKLFGSALTSTEKAEFDKANINPGMTPKAIRENLALQERATKSAAAKLAGTYSKMGYSQEQIESALGVPLSDLGVSAAKPATKGISQQEYNALPSGATYVAPDGSTRTKR